MQEARIKSIFPFLTNYNRSRFLISIEKNLKFIINYQKTMKFSLLSSVSQLGSRGGVILSIKANQYLDSDLLQAAKKKP